MKRWVAGVVVIAIACWSSVAAKNVSVAGLSVGESIEIRYESYGCFHQTGVNVEIRKTQAYVAAVTQGLGDDPVNVVLSADDVKHLDELLLYYSTLNRRGGCTTRDEISVVWQRPAFGSSSERFSDGTCQAPGRGLRVLYRLLQAVEP